MCFPQLTGWCAQSVLIFIDFAWEAGFSVAYGDS